MTPVYVVTASCMNRRTRRQMTDPRRERVDPETNELFRSCRTALDVERAYEAFWNDLNTESEHVVKVLGVETIVRVCAYCPDRMDQTAAARAAGFDVSHGMCPACERREHELLNYEEARRAKPRR